MTSQTNQTKKILLIVSIVVLSLCEFLFLLTAIVALTRTPEEGGGIEIASQSLFVIALFGFGLWWTIRKLKELKGQIAPITPYHSSTKQNDSGDNVIKLQVKLELAEYRKLIYMMTATTPVVVFMYIIGLFMISFSVIQWQFNWFSLFFLVLLLYMPIAVYRSARANYNATKILHEPVTYEITADTIASSGTTFNYSIAWNSLHKTKEVKDFFLLYTNKQVAMLIPKRAFGSVDEMNVFRGYCGMVR
jgi:hypothetical protein